MNAGKKKWNINALFLFDTQVCWCLVYFYSIHFLKLFI